MRENLSKLNLTFFSILAIILLFLSGFFIQNFRIDASSDTLVAQNDEKFEYYNSYNKIFKSENLKSFCEQKYDSLKSVKSCGDSKIQIWR